MLNFIVCDDIKEQVSYVDGLIRKNCSEYHTVFPAYTGKDVLDILKNKHIDIIFMDIELSDCNENGINIVKEINSVYPHIVIIFMSAYNDYFESVYETSHIYFLRKPFDEKHFINALNKAVAHTKNTDTETLIIKNKHITLRIKHSDIFYLESLMHNVKIHLKNDIKNISSIKLSEIEAILKNNTFVRCHQSFIVNFSKISKISKQYIELENNIKIPISRHYSAKVNDLFTLYLGGAL